MKKILYIDNDKHFAKILATYLQKYDWQLSSIDDINSIDQIIKTNTFHIIALDTKFITDDESIKYLSKVLTSNEAIIIGICSNANFENSLKAIKLGVYDLISKPFNLHDFYTIIEKAYSFWQSKNDSKCLLSALKDKIAELEKAYSELKKEKTRLSTFLKEMTDAIILMNSKGKIILVNSKAIELFNISIVDNKIHYESSNLKEVVSKMREAIKTRKSTTFQFSIGEKRQNHYNVKINPIVSDNEIEIYAIINDITEIIKNYELRSSLISKLSHELRTPISNIKSALHLLRKKLPPLEPECEKFFNIITEEINHLSNDINNIFDFAYISSKQIDITWSLNNLNTIIKETVKEVSSKYIDKDIDLSLKLPTFIKEFAFDKEKMQKAIKSIIENAFKFTPPKGSVQITVEVFPDFHSMKSKYFVEGDLAGKAQYALIIIKDNGPGIEPQELNKIFEPFYQAESIFDHQHGTGLGLYICKSIVEAHGGLLWAESKLGEGSSFFIAIPIIGEIETETKKAFLKVRL
jgi:two-component system sensor histidine kinase ResE